MPLVTRAQWGARRPKSVRRREMKGRTTGHWNGPTARVSGKTTWDHSKCASLVRGVQNFHMDGRGWNDIAYNFVVCPHGYVYEGRGLNVTNGANGTNTGNMTCHAVMWLAGEQNPFTEAEKAGFREAVAYIDKHTAANSNVQGHRDHKATACPGNQRYDWIRHGMPGGKPVQSTPAPRPQPKPGNSGLPILKIGSKGNHVRVVQAVIKRDAGGNITVDGIYGHATSKRVKDLQRIFNLTEDGIVGPDTWKALQFISNFKK